MHVVIEKMREVTGLSTRRLVGCSRDEFIAAHVTTASGSHPGVRAVRHVVSRCEKPEWFPGKERLRGAGRPPVYSQFRKQKIAEVAMQDLKRKRIAPTPRRVRQRLPGLTRNPVTGEAMDDKTMHAIFKTRCYDEKEDDP